MPEAPGGPGSRALPRAVPAPGREAATTARQRACAEIAAVVLGLLAILWRAWEPLGLGPLGRRVAPLALGAVVAAVALRALVREPGGARALGLSPAATWGRGWSPLLAFTALGVAALAAAGAALGTASLESARWRWLDDYALGLVAQQVLLQSFLAQRLHALAGGLAPAWREAASVLGAASLFAALHAPNLALVAGTAVAGAFWCRHFRTYRNLAALVVSHLALGVAAMLALGPGPMLDLRVGAPALERMLELPAGDPLEAPGAAR